MRIAFASATLLGVELTCLIIDDNDEFLSSATSLLESEGALVLGVARTMTASLGLAERLSPDVALVDVELGAESGFDVARLLHSLPKAVPAIMISTHSEHDLADMLATSPAIGFLPKSRLSLNQIRGMLRAWRPET